MLEHAAPAYFAHSGARSVTAEEGHVVVRISPNDRNNPPGKLADAVFVHGDAINLIRVGAPAIAAVLKRGAVVSGALPS